MTATETTTETPIDYTVEGGIATITLNRPDRLNAWTEEMQLAYRAALESAGDDDDVKVIVVTGAGKGFCAGAEMSLLQADAADGGQGQGSRDGALTHADARSIPKPVIAAVNGACAGIGFVHMLMCDLRFAARGAKFSTAFARRGLVAEHGASWLLPRMIGAHRAFDLLASGRKFDADEANELGLLNGVFDKDTFLDDVYAYARDLADNCSPTAMAAIKYQIYHHLEVGFDSAMHESFALLQRALQRPDVAEGGASFVEKRPPRFAPVSEFRSL